MRKARRLSVPLGPAALIAATLGLAIVCAAPAAAEPGGLTLEAGELEPWSVCSITARYPDGLSGLLALYGIGRDGTSVPLFRAAPDYAKSIEMKFWAGGDLDSIAVEATGSGGETLRATLGLPYYGADDRDGSRLAELTFPYREMLWGIAPASLELDGNNPASASKAAAGKLFAAVRRPASLAIPAAWSLLAIALSFIGRKRGARTAAITIASALIISLAVALWAKPGAELFALDLPAADAAFTAALERERGVDHDSLRWSARDAVPGDGTALTYIAIRSPSRATVRLAELEPYSRLRFRSAPVIELGADGEYRIAAGQYIDAWGIRDE